MQTHKKLYIAIAIFATLTFSCQFLSVPITPTPTPSPTQTNTPLPPTSTNTLPPPTATETPEPTLTPTRTPRPGKGIGSLCLNVETINHDDNLHGDIQRVLADVFGKYGMDLSKGTCDATLSITVTYGVSSAEYKDSDTGKYRTCYTGKSAVGEMVFEKPEFEPKVYIINNKILPPSGTIYTCPDDEKYADLSQAWSGDVINGLYAIFGPEVLGHILFHGFVGGSPYLMHAAEKKLESLGQKALACAPVILKYLNDRYGDELPDFDPSSSSAVSALKAISGEDFGRDLNAWNSWWENQQ
jgi:hypothetical protein